MKISKNRLKEIVCEEFQLINENPQDTLVAIALNYYGGDEYNNLTKRDVPALIKKDPKKVFLGLDRANRDIETKGNFAGGEIAQYRSHWNKIMRQLVPILKKSTQTETMKISKEQLKELIREELDSEIEWNAFKTGYTKLVDELANDYTKASSILISSIKKINRQTHDDWDDSKAAQHDKGRRAAFKIHGQMYGKFIKYFRNFSDGALKNLFYDTDVRPWDLKNLSRKAFDIDLKPQYTSILIDKWSPKMRDLRKKEAENNAKRGLKEIESYNHAYEFEWTLGNMIRLYDAFHEDFSKISGLQSIVPGVSTIFKAGSSHFARNKNFNAKKQESLAIDKIKKYCDTLNTRVKNKVARMLTKIEKEIAKAKKATANETRQTESHKLKITKSRFKEIVREELAELRNISEAETSLSGKELATKIKNSKDKGHKMFFGKKTIDAIAKKSKWTAKELDQELPDFIPGNLIHGLFNENVNEYVDVDLLTERKKRPCSPKRKGPCDSATEFKKGDVKKGQDGNYWQIIIASNGIPRWQKLKDQKKVDKKKVIKEMRPHVSKSLPGEAIWQSMEDSDFEWEDYLGKGGMKELEKQLKKMKKVTPTQFDQMVPGFIPGNEVYGVFKNHLAIGPTE